MREINLLFHRNITARYIKKKFRDKIEHKIIASLKGKDFYDGNRKYGYGGYRYDKRWEPIAKRIKKKFNIKSNNKILHINCDKGFFLYEIKKLIPKCKIIGLESSKYAIEHSKKEIKNKIFFNEGWKLNYPDKSFDFIFAPGYIYEFNIRDTVKALKEIRRVSKNKKNIYISLGSYDTEQDLKKMKHWSLLGTTFLKKEDWKKVLRFCKYDGFYEFNNAKKLNLKYLK
jgi:hypothetical protein